MTYYVTIINEFAVCCFTSPILVALVNIILVRSQELGPGFNSHPVVLRRVVLCRLNYISCRGFSQKWSLGLFRGKGMRLLWIYRRRRDVVVKLQWNSWSSALGFLIKFTWGSLSRSPQFAESLEITQPEWRDRRENVHRRFTNGMWKGRPMRGWRCAWSPQNFPTRHQKNTKDNR